MSNRVYTKKNRADAPGLMVGVRLQPDQLQALDDWRARDDRRLSRPEAVRQLMSTALAAETGSR